MNLVVTDELLSFLPGDQVDSFSIAVRHILVKLNERYSPGGDSSMNNQIDRSRISNYYTVLAGTFNMPTSYQ